MAPIPPTILVSMFLLLAVLGLILASGRVGTPRDDLSEWQWLAERYTATERPRGQTLLGKVRGFGPRAQLVVDDPTSLVVSASGLYLYPDLFYWGRSPLLIPWSDIELVAERQVLWSHTFELELAGKVHLHVRGDAWEAIEPHLSGANDRRRAG